MEAFLRNLRLSIRQFRRQPGISAAAISTLGLAIGANTAVFSFVNALLLHPFPFRDSEQLFEIYSIRGGQPGRISLRELLDMREQISVLDGIAGRTAGFGGYNFSGDGKPEEWKTVLITSNLFEVLGVPLAIGNKWPELADRSHDNRVIISYGAWQRSFSGSRGVVGRNIVLDHAEGYRIDGVAQDLFDYPRGIDVYRSLSGFKDGERRDFRNLVGVARVKRPYGVSQLQGELDALGTRLAPEFPDSNSGLSFRAESFRNVYSGNVRPYLLVIFGAVLFVLAISCGNVVNLLLSRALARSREIAIRRSLGASRWNLTGQLLTESVMLSIASAGVGLALAFWAVKALRAMIGVELPAWMAIEINWPVLIFVTTVAILTGIVSGLAPALHAVGPSSESLKSGGRGGTSNFNTGLLRDFLVTSEIAVALLLLAGAGLLVRTFGEMQSRDRGFHADSISTCRVLLGWKRYIDQATISRYYDRAADALSAEPGFDEVALAPNPPLARQEEESPNTVQIENQSTEEALRNPYVVRQSISENYFHLLRIPVKEGRAFTKFDRSESEPVAIVCERLAQRLWPGRDPIGQKIRYGPKSKDIYRRVIGVVGNVQQSEFAEPGYDYYVPFRQQADANEYVLVRSRMPIQIFQSRTEQALWGIDREQSVTDFKTYDERILAGIWQLRLSRTLLVLFATVALVLASIGIYGVTSYTTLQRTREMSIRLALGATPANIRSLVIGRAVVVGVIGVFLGLLGGIGLDLVLQRLLPGIAGADLRSLLISVAALFGTTLVAAAIPSWRISRVDPAIALRQE